MGVKSADEERRGEEEGRKSRMLLPHTPDSRTDTYCVGGDGVSTKKNTTIGGGEVDVGIQGIAVRLITAAGIAVPAAAGNTTAGNTTAGKTAAAENAAKEKAAKEKAAKEKAAKEKTAAAKTAAEKEAAKLKAAFEKTAAEKAAKGKAAAEKANTTNPRASALKKHIAGKNNRTFAGKNISALYEI